MNPTPLSLSTYGISIYSTLRKFPRDLSIKQKGCRNLENEKRKRQIAPKCDGCSMISRRHSSATPSTFCASSAKVTKIVSENDNTRHVYARVGHHDGKWFESGVGRKHRFGPEPTDPGAGFTPARYLDARGWGMCGPASPAMRVHSRRSVTGGPAACRTGDHDAALTPCAERRNRFRAWRWMRTTVKTAIPNWKGRSGNA